MDIEEVRRLRDEYEATLDDLEAHRAAYHRAIKKLHLAGMPLREIAQALGISHQRVHQIVSGELPARKKRSAGRRAGIAALVLLIGAGGWLAGVRFEGPEPSRPVALTTVPAVQGIGLMDASALISAAELCLRSIAVDISTQEPPGTVLAIEPPSGTPMLRHADIRVTIAAPILYRFHNSDLRPGTSPVRSSFAGFATAAAGEGQRVEVAPVPLVDSQPACTGPSAVVSPAST